MKVLLAVLSFVWIFVHPVRADLPAADSLLVNGDFASGDFTGWTLFTSDNGSLGTRPGLPSVTSFDTDGDGVFNSAAVFQVGEAAWLGSHQPAGGGIRQFFVSAPGQLSVDLEIAVSSEMDANDEAGIFSLFIDNTLLNAFNFESVTPDIPPYTTQRGKLSGSMYVDGGLHELTIRIERPVLAGEETPRQYVDNIVAVIAIPEPGAALLVLLGLAVCLHPMARSRISRSTSRLKNRGATRDSSG